MINSILKYEESKQKYPYIGADLQGNVVLFTSESTGTRLRCPFNTEPIGEVADNWGEFDFLPINGTITLSNK